MPVDPEARRLHSQSVALFCNKGPVIRWFVFACLMGGAIGFFYTGVLPGDLSPYWSALWLALAAICFWLAFPWLAGASIAAYDWLHLAYLSNFYPERLEELLRQQREGGGGSGSGSEEQEGEPLLLASTAPPRTGGLPRDLVHAEAVALVRELMREAAHGPLGKKRAPSPLSPPRRESFSTTIAMPSSSAHSDADEASDGDDDDTASVSSAPPAMRQPLPPPPPPKKKKKTARGGGTKKPSGGGGGVDAHLGYAEKAAAAAVAALQQQQVTRAR